MLQMQVIFYRCGPQMLRMPCGQFSATRIPSSLVERLHRRGLIRPVCLPSLSKQ